MSKDPKRVAAGKRSRRKGAKFENDNNKAFQYVYGDVVYRGDQTVRGGAGPGEGADTEGTPYWVEAKCGGHVSVHAALRQARQKQEEKGDTRPIVVAVKVDRKEPFVAMPYADWFDMLYELEGYRAAVRGCKHFDEVGLEVKAVFDHADDYVDWLGIINRKVKP